MAIDGQATVPVKPVYTTQDEEENNVQNKGVPVELSIAELSQVLSENPSAAITAVDPIADPSTATAEDVANKVNELIAALQGS